MQLVPVIAIRIGAVETISGDEAAVAVKRVLAQAADMAAEAEVFSADPRATAEPAAAESAGMSHAAEMCAAAKARMSAEAATAEAAVAAATAASLNARFM